MIKEKKKQKENEQNKEEKKIDLLKFEASEEFKKQIAFRESKGKGYQAHNKEVKGMGAVGKYQMREGGLKDIGMIGKDGKWTGKYGVYSIEDFKNNPEAQEKAINDYFQLNNRYLKSNQSYDHLGTKIHGISGQTFEVTQPGLIAGAHRMGAGKVKEYLNGLELVEEEAYSFDYSKVSEKKAEDVFKPIETRIREFENL